jgi:rhodanese-related sulfurtransferase
MTAAPDLLGGSAADDRERALPTHISREDLQARLAGPDRPALVEALGAGFYADAHLPGAINIPPGLVDRRAALILDRAVGVVVYCRRSCTSAEAVARRLEELGFTDVAVYGGGKEDWVEHGLPIERLDPADPPG